MAHTSLLLTDLYQLEMLKSYREESMNDIAVFELFARKLPENRNFLIAAGLEQVIDYLTTLQFSPNELDWLRGFRHGRHYDAGFIDWLAALRFTGDLDAIPEGTPVFASEPLLRVVAPLPEAQLIESRLVNIVHYQTLVASKAARCALVAQGKRLIDFGLRRAHGAEAALFAARASYLAGFDGTATLEAARTYGIPVFGTMAHSYVQAHASETEAFIQFALTHPDGTTLLIDTYDTERGARRVVEHLADLRARGATIDGVRLDSGDLDKLSRAVRACFNEGDGKALCIFASGNLDEHSIAQLLAAGAPIDGFGIGTALAVSADEPAFDCAYKLQEYAGIARRKRAMGKCTWPGRKQVFRHVDGDGLPCFDVLALADETDQGGQALLQPVLRGGKRLAPQPTLEQARACCISNLALLPAHLRTLRGGAEYPVIITEALRALTDSVDRMFD